jgi:DNA-binding NtrC family response regulator
MVEIKTPALADRKEDLPLLERFFIQKFAAQYKKPVESMTPRAQILLARHSWPGNVRELENVIGHACMLAASEVIDVADLPQYMRQGVPAGVAGVAPVPAVQAAGAQDGLSFDEQERRVIEQALDRAGGNQVQAARILGITRDKLRYKIKKHNLR